MQDGDACDLQICDALEDQLNVGGNIVDFHSCDFFPERCFDLVIVLQTDNTILYDRLEKRCSQVLSAQQGVLNLHQVH